MLKRSTYERRTPRLVGEKRSAAEALQIVADLVRARAGEIAKGLIEAAQQGELGHAKYLYELAGIHPPGLETVESKPEDSPTYIWLKELASSVKGSDKDATSNHVSG